MGLRVSEKTHETMQRRAQSLGQDLNSFIEALLNADPAPSVSSDGEVDLVMEALDINHEEGFGRRYFVSEIDLSREATRKIWSHCVAENIDPDEYLLKRLDAQT